jgi:hypothetical protein
MATTIMTREGRVFVYAEDSEGAGPIGVVGLVSGKWYPRADANSRPAVQVAAGRARIRRQANGCEFNEETHPRA